MLIVQLSDPHIDLHRPEKSGALRRAIDHLLSLPMRPDAVLVSGDCTEHGWTDEYALLRELLRPLTVPTYLIPGNHDDREEFLKAFGPQGTQGLPGFAQFVVELGPVRVLALDTHCPGANGGQLDAPRLGWLAERLGEAPRTPTLIALHHPPLLTGLKVMDSIGLDGTQALQELVGAHPQVEAVVAGHLHMRLVRRFAGTLVMTAPALEYAWLPDLTQPDKLIVQRQPPGYLLHHFTPDTGLTTYASAVSPGPWETLHDGQGWAP